MADPFESSRRKIARAKHHIGELDTGLILFMKERPYEKIIQADAEPGYKLHKARLSKPIPSNWSLVIGDAVTNLRAALDHMMYSCAVISGNAGADYRQCSFPFSFGPKSFPQNLAKRTAVPKEILACLAQFKPYMGGNDAFCALDEMCNRDKHAMITPTVIGYFGHSMVRLARHVVQRPRNPEWDRAKNEIELFRTKEDFDYDFSLTIQVIFDSPKAIEFKPFLVVLSGFVREVESVLMTIEAECRRIGLIV